ncbi:hypothetical protein IU500_33425 [Nocardia terpenica]|uniref:hypothetical protein n=1 Tax=Nocardia terpenica TaxID=455432 RepID=UPI00189591D0|nr:hypothetical protein [Nocardia terpenica]MBF6065350.1 hypothetical protein [Nocardia terpenica]MBF6108922.1 hypothetical protein [Nocardia terpenica]MBF6121765.1 hypothetical protein [Nocardia terpenica]
MKKIAEPRIPRAPGAIPVISHARQFLGHPLGFVSSLPDHGDVVEVRFGPRRVSFVCDPELIQTVMLDDATFDRGGELFDRSVR